MVCWVAVGMTCLFVHFVGKGTRVTLSGRTLQSGLALKWTLRWIAYIIQFKLDEALIRRRGLPYLPSAFPPPPFLSLLIPLSLMSLPPIPLSLIPLPLLCTTRHKV